MCVQEDLGFSRYTCVHDFPFKGKPEVVCLVRPSVGDQILLIKGADGWTFPSGERRPCDKLLRDWSYRVLRQQYGITEGHISLRCLAPFLGEQSSNGRHLVLAQIRLSSTHGLFSDTRWVNTYGHLMAYAGKMCIQDSDRFQLIRAGINALYEKREFSWHCGIYK